MTTRELYRGTGPGPITADGCTVDFYATLAPSGDPERIHAAIPAGASILELGAGTRRITHSLLALGHDVTGAATLSLVQGAGVDLGGSAGGVFGFEYASVDGVHHIQPISDLACTSRHRLAAQ